jgi:hypothetical protein
MIMDERGEFADNVSVAASAGTALIGDVIDLGSTASDIGNGEPLFLVIQTGATELASDAAAAIATDGSASAHFDTGELVTDDAGANDARLNAGGVIAMVALPLGTYERYLGILCITATTTTTAGTINAFLTKDPSKWIALPDAPGTFI